MAIRANDIFTPQGILEEVEKDPKMDFLMNIFNIPRAFGVSGFGGNWDVGKHSFATALIAIFWSNFNKYPDSTKNKLVTMALLHDLHESVTGDILPMFKTEELRNKLDELQDNILEALKVENDEKLETDLKICDLVAFLYEVKQVSPNIMQPKKLGLANTMATKQLETIYKYAEKKGVEKKKLQKFLNWLEI